MSPIATRMRRVRFSQANLKLETKRSMLISNKYQLRKKSNNIFLDEISSFYARSELSKLSILTQ
jgi:hypothetical protein